MKITDQNSRFKGFITLATFVLVVAVLKIGQEVLIPIALTVLLTFLLSPAVVRLTRWGLPKAVAILVTVTVAFSVIGGVSWILFTQTVALIHQLPDYEDNIRKKITSIKAPHGPDTLGRMSKMVKELQHELEAAPKPAKGTPGAVNPVPVEVKAPEPSSLEVTRDLIGGLAAPLGSAAIVIVFVVAMLFQREDLRDRFINVVSAGKLNLATQALDDAARRVARYLFMQLVVNATYGVPVGIALSVIGVPNALLWGLLATLLRFVPFLGPWIAAAFPVALAAAVDPGWSMLLYTLGIFVVMETVSNNVVEPLLYGSSTGISNLALMVAAVFWTWLWGTAGLFLSTPLTVCIMVLGKYMPGLQFVSVLLGSEPALDPAAKFYQRMLSMDLDEMRSIALAFIEHRSVEEFYNEIFVPALLMSEQDRHSGTLAEVRQKFIFEASRDLIEELERRSFTKLTTNTQDAAKGGVSIKDLDDDRIVAPVVFGMPARDDADEVVALMLQHLLRARGIETEVVPVTAHADDLLRWIKQYNVGVTFISALPPAALVGTRQLCRRIKESSPQTHLLVGVWSRDVDFEELKLRLRRPKPDAIVTNLGEAVRQIESMLAPSKADPSKSEESGTFSEPAEKAESAQVPALHLSEVEPYELFGTVTRNLAQHFDVPMSLVTITTLEPQFWKAHADIAPDGLEPAEASASTVLPSEEILMVEDVSKDKRFSGNTLLGERGIRFYGAVPLRNRNGRLVGILNVVDTKPRAIQEVDKAILLLRAAELMEAVESATSPPVSTPAAETL